MVDDPYRGRYLERIEYPPLTDAEREVMADAVAVLEQSLRPGNRAVMIAALTRLAVHRAKERSADEWRMIFEDYAEDLAEYSNAHVQEAIVEHRRGSNFFPTPAELRSRCASLKQRDEWRLERAHRMMTAPHLSRRWSDG